ncbi:hypothetical protein L9F63_014121, partial [Diploptera punctata]
GILSHESTYISGQVSIRSLINNKMSRDSGLQGYTESQVQNYYNVEKFTENLT